MSTDIGSLLVQFCGKLSDETRYLGAHLKAASVLSYQHSHNSICSPHLAIPHSTVPAMFSSAKLITLVALAPFAYAAPALLERATIDTSSHCGIVVPSLRN